MEQISELVDEEKKLKKYGMPKTFKELSYIKSMGFSDDKIAELTKTTANEVKKQRKQLTKYLEKNPKRSFMMLMWFCSWSQAQNLMMLIKRH